MVTPIFVVFQKSMLKSKEEGEEEEVRREEPSSSQNKIKIEYVENLEGNGKNVRENGKLTTSKRTIYFVD